MSNAADVAPYLQAWLDARAPLNTAKSEFTTAQTNVQNARAALQTAVTTGNKTAVQAQPEVQAWLDAQAVYVIKDAAVRAAQAALDLARQTFEQMALIASSGGTVPPFGTGGPP